MGGIFDLRNAGYFESLETVRSVLIYLESLRCQHTCGSR